MLDEQRATRNEQRETSLEQQLAALRADLKAALTFPREKSYLTFPQVCALYPGFSPRAIRRILRRHDVTAIRHGDFHNLRSFRYDKIVRAFEAEEELY